MCSSDLLLVSGPVKVRKTSMGPATAKATRSARCRARDFGTSSPRITWRLVIKTKATPKTLGKKKPARKSRPKAQPKGIAGAAVGAVHTVVDAVKETDALGNKMVPPGTSDS